ncbi:L-threonylcarbamoyladenylate synthase [Floccifex sp.]|uniref:L-threonylcarbamoyladenylate synthase n=1 Tax=Floccifex sp. TaxID=2815810 RepID=UPI003F02CCC8|nr:L-threonylcarbamoyladenylate synthase [Erysipelotrichaceae bacterium]
MLEFNTEDIDLIVEAFSKDLVLAFPTDTVYGVGVKLGLDNLKHLKSVKNRVETKPIPVMCANLEQIESIAVVSEQTKKIVQNFLPGALTLILPVKNLPKEYTNGMDTIAIRIPDEPFVLQVIDKLKSPLFVTSANQSGNQTSLTYEDAKRELPALDGIVYGTCKALQASTILDCTNLKVLRQGPITLEQIKSVL